MKFTVQMLIVVCWPAVACRGVVDDDLSVARLEFERHNYQSALAALDRWASDAVPAEPTSEVRALRARCLLKLRRWDEGVALMTDVLAGDPSDRARPELHIALAEVGRFNHRYKYLSINHFAAATELYLTAGDREAAAGAAIRCGQGFVQFNDWDRLDDSLVPPVAEGGPSGLVAAKTDWRAARALQRRLAVQWLDRGVALTKDPATASAATLAKAKLFHQTLRLHDEDIETAMATYRELVRRWPTSLDAPRALLEIGRLLERHKQDYVGAATQYRETIDRFGRTREARSAAVALERIVAPVIRLGTEGVARPGTRARIDIETRNVSSITFDAFRVDLFDLIREIGDLNKLDAWSPRGAATARWSIEVPDTGEHKTYRSVQDQVPATSLPVTTPGAYVVRATSNHDAKPVRAQALVLVSRLAAISKGHKGGALLWTTDAADGRPAAGTRVLVQTRVGRDRYDYREGATDEQGFFDAGSAGRKRGLGVAFYLRDGDQYAICDASFSWYWWGYQNDYRLYSFTDRPVYRPDQVIHFKHVLRRYDAGDYHNVAQTRVAMTVYDPNGQAVVERSLTTNAHGSVSGDLSLPNDAPLGVYRMQVEVAGKSVYTGRGGVFRVEEYRKPEFEVTVGAARSRFAFGEAVDVRIEARYYFGSPVPDADVKYTVYRSPVAPPIHYPAPYPWYFEQLRGWWSRRVATCLPGYCFMPWRTPKSLIDRGELTTDADGVALLRIQPTDGDDADAAREGWRYIIEVEATDASRRTVTGSGEVNVTRAPFAIRLSPQRQLYQPGDNVQIDIEARGPNGEPIAFDGRMRIHRLARRINENADGSTRDVFELGAQVFEGPCSADKSGVTRFRLRADQEGPFRFVLSTATDDGVDVTATCDVWITQRGGRFDHYAYRDVELLPDKYVYEVGDTARLLVNTRFDDAWVLLTIEADDLLDRRLLHVDGGSTVVEMPIETMHTPNFYVAVTVLRDHKVHQDMQAIVVPPTERFLHVAIAEETGDRTTYPPREETRFTVTTTDARGRAVDAEVAMMMVDASLYYIQTEFRERVQKFFYGKTRPHLVSTRTSFDRASGRMTPRMDVMGRGVVAKSASMAMTEGAASAAMADGAPGDEAAFATAEIRRDFPDSVLWAGHLETGSDGRATMDVAFPDSLTTWRLIAVAVDDDTRVGETSRDLVTRKDVIARLHTPRFLVERDRCRVTVIARNDLEQAKTVRVTLAASGPVTLGVARHDGETVDYVKPNTVDVDVEAGSETAIDFDVSAYEPGRATFTATVATDTMADAVEQTLTVVAFGTQKLVAKSGVIRSDDTAASETVRFTLPAEMNPDTPILEVHLNPTIAGVMLDAIPYLLDYPYGCTEQTMSRFLPAVVTRRTLARMGVKLSELAARVESKTTAGSPVRERRRPVFDDGVLGDIVSVGLHRLGEMQQPDGGWGWWKGGRSDPYMTAYVVYGLAEAKASGVAVDRSMLTRGVDFLGRALRGPAGADASRRRVQANVRAWMLYALSVADPARLGDADTRRAIDAAFADRDDLTDYTRAMLALVLHAVGDGDRATTVIDNLDNTVHFDEASGTAGWGWESGYVRWYRNGTEATAMVLRALLAINPDHRYVIPAANWLVRNRQGGRWHSTKDTAFAIYALADYLSVSGELDPDMTVTVTYDDTVRRSFRITSDDVLAFDARIIFAPRHLTPGEHTIRIDREGHGNVYHATYVDYYTREDPIEAAGRDVRLRRTYARLIPKEVERTRPVWDARERKYVQETYTALDYDRKPLDPGASVVSGDLIEVSLQIEADNAFEYILLEDPKPAGCEPVALHSGYAVGEGLWSNVELRDRHTALFVSYLSPGTHAVTYRLRCETPGTFGALPTRLEAMYSPYVRANASSRRLVIQP